MEVSPKDQSRVLDAQFMADLQEGKLAPLRKAIAKDRDLLFQSRNRYINVYFKGHSLLKLDQRSSGYSIVLDKKFRPDSVAFPDFLASESDTEKFVDAIRLIKERIVDLSDTGKEIEYEQMLIRANNSEPRNNTDYYIVDRQVTVKGQRERLDLVGIHWPLRARNRSGRPVHDVPMVVLELKFGVTPHAARIHEQLEGYRHIVSSSIDQIADETEKLLRQKIELGFLAGSSDQLRALQRLNVSRRIEDVRFAIVFVDCNPSWALLSTDSLKRFPNPVDLFHVGFGLWQKNALSLQSVSRE